MCASRLACGALLCALSLGCGERAGDPIVALATSNESGASAPTGAAGAGGAYDGHGTSTDTPGPVGLCGACSSSDECGDANDACVRHLGERFCGRDCDEQHGCPDGYLCVELDNTQLYQCVPQDHCPTTAAALPPLSDIREYLLQRINAQRAAHARLPLDASSCLDELAQASALAFARTDEPLGKYVKECDPIWPSCACGWNAEAELAVAHYALDWTTAIDRATSVTRDNQNDRFVQAFLAGSATAVGVGFWLSGDEAWIALSFH